MISFENVYLYLLQSQFAQCSLRGCGLSKYIIKVRLWAWGLIQVLADIQTQFQPGGSGYAHQVFKTRFRTSLTVQAVCCDSFWHHSLGNYQIEFSVSVTLCNHHWNLQKRLSTVCQFTQGHYARRHVDKHLRVNFKHFLD